MVSAASTTTTDSGQRSHLRPILRLGGPLVINNLAYAGITFADTVMAGHISPCLLYTSPSPRDS